MNEELHQPKLGAILLAAGPSTRLGHPKQLVKVRGESLVRRSARILSELGLESVIVVTGCESESVQAELSGLEVEAIFNREWEIGMGASIACGAKALPKGLEGVLVMVCDQWRIEREDLVQLIASWLSDISMISIANWKEGSAYVSGPPVIFPRNIIQELRFVEKSRGARQIIDRNIEIVQYMTIENAAFDLDRPEDLQRLDQ